MSANPPPVRSGQRRRQFFAIAGAVAISISAASISVGTAAADRNGNPKPPGNPDPKGQLIDLQLLGINDYHGHVEANTPGSIEGAAAGGAEYLSAKLAELRQGNKYSLTVAAGDLIGGSPAFSGLFHDEPSVESLNAMQLDVSSVGNHEFDEGVTELLRMQHGGCHPVDGCYFPEEPYPGADFQWLAANVVNETTGETPLLVYATASSDAVKAVQARLGAEQAGELVEVTLARIATGLVDAGVGQLIVAGGETSGACVQALGVRQLRIGPQIDPGVPWCHAEDRPLHLALKSGNFGGTDFFSRAFDII